MHAMHPIYRQTMHMHAMHVHSITVYKSVEPWDGMCMVCALHTFASSHQQQSPSMSEQCAWCAPWWSEQGMPLLSPPLTPLWLTLPVDTHTDFLCFIG